MTLRIDQGAAIGPPEEPRQTRGAMLRGWRQRCPACGDGRLYGRYLKVVPACAACGEELHHHRSDDAPPYFTMFIVGHLLCGGALALEQSIKPDYWVHLALWLPLTIGFSLWLLPRIKGALVGLQWAQRMHGFGRGDNAAATTVPSSGGG
jgi:uncharacterized protein (DUF983 family)